ncbi:vacuolar fusion protein, putative [Babesia ovis]|uniref:Vacuolar fusion protein, putative n=1 Tax=Babesia ovis TaxID=5869 RepID=A0A9W5TAF6_BABOV|nr:vacuolar fusion protein, putative [Babesia ovis]
MTTKVYAFTYAGKPLFTNCADGEDSLAFYGVLCAVVSKVSTLLSEYTEKDELRYISAGDQHFVYMERGPLCYFGISSNGASPLAVYKILSNLHLQVLSILTRGVEHVLLKRPSYDVQNLLGGTQSILHNLVANLDGSLGLFDTCCYEALPLPPTTRNTLRSYLTEFNTPNVLCSFMVVSNRVAVITMSKNATFSPSDIAIVVNMVSTSHSLRQQESWTPLCLPDFNDQAFTYAYVNYIDSDIGIVCISSTGDQDQFHKISGQFGVLTKKMTDSGSLGDLRTSLVATPLEFPSTGGKTCSILHVLYYSKRLGQYFSSAFRPTAFGTDSNTIVSAYKSVSEFLFSNEPNRTAMARFECFNVYVDHNPEFSLYLSTEPWTTITSELVSGVTSYVTKQYRFLFNTRVPHKASR